VKPTQLADSEANYPDSAGNFQRLKERNSTINEDPASDESGSVKRISHAQPTTNVSMVNTTEIAPAAPIAVDSSRATEAEKTISAIGCSSSASNFDTGPQSSQTTTVSYSSARRLRSMANRLSGFFRRLSTTSTSTWSPSGRLSKSGQLICNTCGKPVQLSGDEASTTQQQPQPNSEELVSGSAVIECNSTNENGGNRQEESTDNEKDFTTAVLVGDALSSGEHRPISAPLNAEHSSALAMAAVRAFAENIILKGNSGNSSSSSEPAQTQLYKKSANESIPKSSASIHGTFFSNNSSSSSSSSNSNSQNQPFRFLAGSLEPKNLLSIIQERLESYKKVDVNASTMGGSAAVGTQPSPASLSCTQVTAASAGTAATASTAGSSRIKCMPSARTVSCQDHCVAVLATRLFAIMCNENEFQQKLMADAQQEQCFNIIVDVLYPNNDPVRLAN
jgi:hypothetical protein